ncbi:MAG TPA: nucleotidyltransferase domain-containing protein [Candidatus Nanoarchaeia archaeon]|nr:nucleotidyltransferase domain-containing protein [Candidatus Nanoarchaeia archaeon]
MVNIYKQKLTNLQQEILRLLFIKSGIIVNARYIAKNLEVSQPAVSKALPYLDKEKLIKLSKDKESKRLSIEINRDNNLVIGLKRADNLKLIYESGLADFLYNSFPGTTIILFGSYAFGEDTIKSDIDLAIIGMKEKHIDIDKFSKQLEREIIINYYSSLKDIKSELKNNILNGIVLKGAVEH